MPIEEGNTTPIEETKTIPIEGKNTNTGKETKTPNTNAVEKLTPEESVKRVEQLINEASGLDINYLSHDPDWKLSSSWDWKEWYFSVDAEPNEQDIAKWVTKVSMDFYISKDYVDVNKLKDKEPESMHIIITKMDADGKTVSDLNIQYSKGLEPHRIIMSNGGGVKGVRETDVIEEETLDIIEERIQKEKKKIIKRELDAAQNNEKQEKQWADEDLETNLNNLT